MKNTSFYWWYRHNIKYIFTGTIYGIKNLIKWFKIVWTDRDWDDYFISRTLAFKIKNTADYIEKYNRYVGCERDVEKMRLCCKLIKKLEDSDYELEYQNYYESSFFSNTNENPPKIIKNNLLEYFNNHPNDFERIYKDGETDISMALSLGTYRTNKAHHLLYTLLERNIRNWWD